jgi:S1-C subfamily serine protease
MLVLFSFLNCTRCFGNDELSEADLGLVKAVQQQRIKAINQVVGSVIAIYDENRKGGGSGVIIDPSGIALTNHHVIMGAGIAGWGGLADGNLYKWKLIGTDPGGDVAVIQMEGKDDFPFTPLGDSDRVRVGDWALAMGNPFILTEDQAPTVTLGIVSGVKRYQYGAGMNQLVYGNCIQVDSSINPGNSGGPLFNLNGEVIGINGRGSFKERGRVNVGLGYAISSNQIKNFIPDLLATKLVEHATLDASFSDRDGKVLCSTLNLDAPVAAAGLELGDELLEFEGVTIRNANQFTNLICTLPEDWPTELKIRKKDGVEKTINIRTFGLPYQKPGQPREQPGKKRTPQEEEQLKRQREMIALLAAPPGEMRFKDINRKYADHLLDGWRKADGLAEPRKDAGVAKLTDRLVREGADVGAQTLWLCTDGRFRLERTLDDQLETFVFDGKTVSDIKDGKSKPLSRVEAKLNLAVVQAMAMTAAIQETPFAIFGEILLDGSDKALKQNAYRMKMTDEDQDEFFFWIRMYGDDDLPAERLLKVSAHKNCDESGGVVFQQWQRVGPLMLPVQREYVTSLDETSTLSIVNESAEWLESADATWFELKSETGDSESSTPDSPAPDSIDSGKERP